MGKLLINNRQEATRKQLEKMKAEDANFESMMEGNDSILPTNLQEPPPPLSDTEKQNPEKTTPSSRLKSGKDCYNLFAKYRNEIQRLSRKLTYKKK